MKLLAYGRVSPVGGEVPLETQKHACQRFCERQKHTFEGWYTDECKRDTDPIERDGFSKMLRYGTNNDFDGILTFDWERVSHDIGIVAGFRPLTMMAFSEVKELYTPEGKVDLTESEEPEKVTVGESMDSLATTVSGWRKKMKGFKVKESLQKKVERGDGHKVGRPPFGLETDKNRFKNRSQVHEYYPDDRGEEDNFKKAIQMLNTFAHENTTPFEKEEQPTAHEVGKKYGKNAGTARSVWKNQETYRDIAEEHRPELMILF